MSCWVLHSLEGSNSGLRKVDVETVAIIEVRCSESMNQSFSGTLIQVASKLSDHVNSKSSGTTCLIYCCRGNWWSKVTPRSLTVFDGVILSWTTELCAIGCAVRNCEVTCSTSVLDEFSCSPLKLDHVWISATQSDSCSVDSVCLLWLSMT